MGRDDGGDSVVIGHNHEFISRWVIDNGLGVGDGYLDILDAATRTHEHIPDFWHPDRVVSASREDSLVLVIQICLTALNLNPISCNINKSVRSPTNVPNFDSTQVEAYADHEKQPIFVGMWKQDINVRWLLSTVQFFKYHFRQPTGEGLLGTMYDSLEPDQLPQPWVGKLVEGTQELGTNWKGAFSKYSKSFTESPRILY